MDGELDRTLGGQTVTGLGTREIDGVNYLTADSIISNRTEDGANLVFSTIPIHANLRAADADGAIRVTAIEAKSGHVLRDLAGNLYTDGIAANANSTP